MFSKDTIVKILVPNVVNHGYDYRLSADAEIGTFVRCSVMNHPYIGIVYGAGDSDLPPEKIKSVSAVLPYKLPVAALQWIQKMSEWTLMAPGAVLRLILNVPDAFNEPKTEQLYAYNFESENVKMTESRQMVLDAFQINNNEAMSVNDIQNIARVGPSVVKI